MSRTRTRRLVVAAGLLAVAAAALASWWVYDHFALNAAERSLIGTWTQTRDDGFPQSGQVQVAFRQDRTMRVVYSDAKTGAAILPAEDYDWWGVSDGVLTLRRRQEKPTLRQLRRQWSAWWDGSRPAEFFDVWELNRDGPDRIHYTVWCISRAMTDDPLPTVTWTRVKEE